jgi:hypothetical protein
MTDNRDRSDPIARWQGTIDALEAAVLSAPDRPEIDTAEAKEVQRPMTMHLAAARPSNHAAAWPCPPGIVAPIVLDAKTLSETSEPTPRSPALPPRGFARIGQVATTGAGIDPLDTA